MMEKANQTYEKSLEKAREMKVKDFVPKPIPPKVNDGYPQNHVAKRDL